MKTNGKAPLRIAIVNDMKMACEALKRVVKSQKNCRLLWIAHDGKEAIDKCQSERPDILLMDLRMPNMDGAHATREIMEKTPCAILVVTADVQDNMSMVFEAMSHGALDAVATPRLGREGLLLGANELIRKIETIGSLIHREQVDEEEEQSISKPQRPTSPDRPDILVIGASTGGPQAIATILSKLPADFGALIAVVQHVDEQFAQGLASWLNDRCELSVKPALAGVHLEPGTVWVAATNNHMILNEGFSLSYHSQPEDLPYRPSVDVFFKSVAKSSYGRGVGVLLTGMGHDGAEGMKALQDAGFLTLAQDKLSCVVWGMPRAAERLKAVQKSLPPEKIAEEILKYFTN